MVIDNYHVKQIMEFLKEMRYSRPKRVMTVEEAAAYLGVAKSLLTTWAGVRDIPHSKSQPGNIIYFDREKLIEWALKHEVPTREDLKKALKRNEREE